MKKIVLIILVFGLKIASAQNVVKTDTLIVSQGDTLFFKKMVSLSHRPCQKPRLETFYDLKNLKDGVYYLIYNEKKQLTREGKYTSNYTYEGVKQERGGFYDSKSYYYKNNGTLEFIHYQKEGRNSRIEYFNRKKRLKKIRYINKKSDDTEKIEIYKKGKLTETRIYTAFSKYSIIKKNVKIYLKNYR